MQFSNAVVPIETTLLGIVNDPEAFSHPLNAEPPISVNELAFSKLILFKLEQLKNAKAYISFKFKGISNEPVAKLHDLNAFCLMESNSLRFPISMLCNDV